MAIWQLFYPVLLKLQAWLGWFIPQTWQPYWQEMKPMTKGFLTVQVALFVGAIVWYLGPLFLRRLQLLEAGRTLKRLAVSAGESPEEVRGRAQETLFRTWWLGSWAAPSFLSFVASWRDARLPEEDRACVPVHLRSFLSPDLVVHQAANQRASEALPGIFLAVGIFGTFLGLVLGLKDLNLGNVNQMEEGVRRLVEGLSLAFMTSLVGIMSSVLFSFAHKHGLKVLAGTVRRVDRWAAELFPCAAEELVARRLLETQLDVKAELQKMATDIATQISDTMGPVMDQAVENHLAPVINDIRDILSGFTDRAAQAQDEAVETMLRRYVDMLQGTFRQQIEDIAKLIEATTEAQGKIRQELAHFGEQIAKQFALQAELIEKTAQAGQVLNASLDGLSSVSTELSGSASLVSEAAGHLSASAEQARQGQAELRDTIERQIAAMTVTKEGLEQSWQVITSGTESVVEHLRGLMDRMADTLGDQLTNALNSFDGKLGEVVQRFSGTLFDTRETVNEFPTFLGDLSGHFDAMNTQLESIKGVVEQLRETTSNLVAPQMEQAASAAADMVEAARATQSTAAALDGWLSGLDERLQGHVQGFGALVDRLTENQGDGEDKSGRKGLFGVFRR